jgi:hypothetical protein
MLEYMKHQDDLPETAPGGASDRVLPLLEGQGRGDYRDSGYRAVGTKHGYCRCSYIIYRNVDTACTSDSALHD